MLVEPQPSDISKGILRFHKQNMLKRQIAAQTRAIRHLAGMCSKTNPEAFPDINQETVDKIHNVLLHFYRTHCPKRYQFYTVTATTPDDRRAHVIASLMDGVMVLCQAQVCLDYEPEESPCL